MADDLVVTPRALLLAVAIVALAVPSTAGAAIAHVPLPGEDVPTYHRVTISGMPAGHGYTFALAQRPGTTCTPRPRDAAELVAGGRLEQGPGQSWLVRDAADNVAAVLLAVELPPPTRPCRRAVVIGRPASRTAQAPSWFGALRAWYGDAPPVSAASQRRALRFIADERRRVRAAAFVRVTEVDVDDDGGVQHISLVRRRDGTAWSFRTDDGVTRRDASGYWQRPTGSRCFSRLSPIVEQYVQRLVGSMRLGDILFAGAHQLRAAAHSATAASAWYFGEGDWDVSGGEQGSTMVRLTIRRTASGSVSTTRLYGFDRAPSEVRHVERRLLSLASIPRPTPRCEGER